jgi:hypothetical protein
LATRLPAMEFVNLDTPGFLRTSWFEMVRSWSLLA